MKLTHKFAEMTPDKRPQAAQGRASFSSHGITFPLSAQWTRNNAPCKYARASERTSMPNDEHQKVTALGGIRKTASRTLSQPG